MKIFVATILAFLALVAPAQAQDVITEYRFNVYAQGATAPTSTTPFPASAAICNQVPPVSGSTVNPTTVVWDDPAIPGRACTINLAVSAGGGVIVSLPSGTYTGALIAANTEGASAESNRAPFSRTRLPAALTGVRFTR